ncbi:MAG: hypothetical protein DRJ03_05315 [Chloroflexi bacterium]|nr:MAG: hypothetical protein DRJ03_05315 [Chloroflexota bacterium]
MVIELNVFESGKVAEMPIFESHRRGRNWVAMLGVKDGKVHRQFVDRSGRNFRLDQVPVGVVIEIGADYYTGSGRQEPRRLYLRYLGGGRFEVVGVRGRSIRERYPEAPVLENGSLYKVLASESQSPSDLVGKAVQDLIDRFGLEEVLRALRGTVRCPPVRCEP